ncbi:MAG: hypothetical protein EU547_07015 [Promethearchaeota archaeon]|nr:MAG: hypothetical protein EU547_07015 [Candidatus Lokiarchaeota archaeon]
MKQRTLLIVKIFLFIIIIGFYLTIFLPIMKSQEIIDGVPIYNYTNPLLYTGGQIHIYGGWFSFGALMLSLIAIQLLKLPIGIILGYISVILLGFNLFYIIFLCLNPTAEKLYMLHYGFYVDLMIFILIIIIYSFLLILILRKAEKEISNVKKTIIELGTKFTRLDIKDISEKCKENKYTIIRTIKEMIKNKEIYAKYFDTTKTVAFNQQANINEIDDLMGLYREWEANQKGKEE